MRAEISWPLRVALALWQRISAIAQLGTQGLREDEARNVAMSNYIAMLAGFNNFTYALGHILYAPRAHLPITLTLFTASAVWACGIYLNHRRQHKLARTLMVFNVTALLVQNDWFLSRDLGSNHFFFCAVPAVLLIYPQRERRAMFFALIVLLGGFLACRGLFVEPQIPVAPEFLTAYNYICSLTTFLLLAAFYFLFYIETHRVELMREMSALRNLDQYRQVMDNVLEGVFRASYAGRLESVNPAGAHMLGYESPEALRATVSDFRQQVLDNPDDVRKIQTKLLEDGQVSGFEVPVRRADGSRFTGLLSVRALKDAQGVITGYDGILADITQRKEKELLNTQREMAEAASRAKTEFLAKMSHEIRTPMNAVIGFTDLALRSTDTERRADYLQQIRSSSRSLLAIINDVLDLSKIESGKLRLEQCAFSLEALLDRISDLAAVQAHEKQLELIVHVEAGLPAQIVGDELRLEQVLINLLNNAIKFTESGEVELRVTRSNAGANDGALRFCVRDTGIGIAPEQLARLFTPFTQADDSTTRKYGGSGLGLSICKQLVELMGSQIEVSSQPGAGSRFEFTVPFGESADIARGTAPLPAEAQGLPVLLVDDNASARQAAAELLRGLGLIPHAVDSSEAALQQLDAQPWALVLMDRKMPGIDGLAASRQVRISHPELPIFLMTAQEREELSDYGSKLGIQGVLSKPLRPRELREAITSLWHPPATSARPSTADLATHRLGGVQVLLVEDNALNQRLAKELLISEGAKVEIAANGAEAVEVALRHLPDLVLMDMQMPVMDGLEATRRIRASGRASALPIIAMTANALDRDRQNCIEAGMNDFISKPIDIEMLVTVMGSWLRESKSRPH